MTRRLHPRGPWVQVMLCVNHPSTGMPTGRCCQVHIHTEDGHELELEGDLFDDRANPTCAFDEATLRLRVGRRTFPIGGHQHHVGNWCWDAVSMQARYATELVAHVLARGFTIQCVTDGCPFVTDDQRAAGGFSVSPAQSV